MRRRAVADKEGAISFGDVALSRADAIDADNS
jgi:hypothetical protein